MCGRMSLSCPDPAPFVAALGIGIGSARALSRDYRPRYNIAPSQAHWLLRSQGGERRVERARWGVDGPRGALVINARSERVIHRGPSMWSGTLRSGRCALLADGFFEWRREGARRHPHWFRRADGQLMLLAGLLDRGRFAVLTTAASTDVAPIHGRMPVILEPEAFGLWLSEPGPAAAPQLLVPAPAGLLEHRAVSTRVNDVSHDDPECLRPPSLPAQRELF